MRERTGEREIECVSEIRRRIKRGIAGIHRETERKINQTEGLHRYTNKRTHTKRARETEIDWQRKKDIERHTKIEAKIRRLEQRYREKREKKRVKESLEKERNR